ncbi:GntR family transcriptional regulator [Microbacterium sp. W4I20]|uniref:GntR family transcriptional regulator n=1 Tax=Microbacterium sp. W4I20 TaxID=3042262 RepID=UPI002784B59E|nr:UTRA domain-containing protein [Microbacterium sp. W4I20]MDQ0727929.1 GntR family transcriptional regulator [Microbacterium sp. W4I20]
MVTPRAPRPASDLVAAVADRLSDVYVEAAKAAQGKLPSEREMAARLGVSRGTLRLALQHLADTGEVTNLPQSGWYASPTTYPAPHGPLLSFTEVAAMRGARLQSRLLRAAVRDSREQESVILELGPESRVFAISRTRILEGIPVCVEHNVIAVDRVPGIDRDFDRESSLYALLETHGARPERSALTAEAALAGDDGEQLGIEAGAPVLVENEVLFGAFGRPIMIARGVWRADRYRFRATFTAAPQGRIEAAAQRTIDDATPRD